MYPAEFAPLYSRLMTWFNGKLDGPTDPEERMDGWYRVLKNFHTDVIEKAVEVVIENEDTRKGKVPLKALLDAAKDVREALKGPTATKQETVPPITWADVKAEIGAPHHISEAQWKEVENRKNWAEAQILCEPDGMTFDVSSFIMKGRRVGFEAGRWFLTDEILQARDPWLIEYEARELERIRQVREQREGQLKWLTDKKAAEKGR